MKYTCKKCGKEYKSEKYYKLHIEKCVVNEIYTEAEVEIEAEIEKEIPRVYTEDELFLIKTFDRFNPNNVTYDPAVYNRLIPIFEKYYGQQIISICSRRLKRMYIFLSEKTNEILNEK